MPYSRRSLAQSRTKLLPDGQLDDVPFEGKLTSHGLDSGLLCSRAPEMVSRVTLPRPSHARVRNWLRVLMALTE